MLLAGYLSENGVKTYCTGGYIAEAPCILAGELTNNAFANFHADVMFFSVGGMYKNMVYCGSEEFLKHHRIMLENSDKHVLLMASDKIDKTRKMILCGLDELDYFITDGEFSDEMIKKHSSTNFVKV